jgi:predicted dehydrogenase
LRWGIIAPGAIASQFVESVLKHTTQTVVAVASRSPERGQAFAGTFGIPTVCASYEELCSHPGVDVVYVASHIAGHLDNARMAIRAGKHVLIEKPLTYRSHDATELLREARDSGVLVMEAMWTRYLPHSDVVRQLVDDGVLGDLEFLQATFAADNRAIDRLWQPGTGGIVFDMGIYPIALAHFFFGPPQAITASGRVRPNGVDEGAHVILNYASGAQASLTISGVATLPSGAAMSGSKKLLILDHPFFVPTSLRLADKDLYFQEVVWHDVSPIQGHEGLSYQANYLAHFVAEGRVESPLHPHDEIINNILVAEEICARIGASPGPLRTPA